MHLQTPGFCWFNQWCARFVQIYSQRARLCTWCKESYREKNRQIRTMEVMLTVNVLQTQISEACCGIAVGRKT